MNDDYDESGDDSDNELSPDEITCPFCGQRGSQCSHLLACFDCTFSREGEYGIGLVAGALFEVKIIGALFGTISDCYASARCKGKKAKLPKSLKGYEFQEYIQALHKTRLDPKDYKSEESYCWDFHVNIEYYDVLVRKTLLELLDGDYCERRAVLDVPMRSSNYLFWFCRDTNATVDKLRNKLAKYLSDFKRENGLV